MQKIIVTLKHVFIFIVLLLLLSSVAVGMFSVAISFVSDENIISFFGVNRKELIEYISELFIWVFILMYLFKSKITNNFYFVLLYLLFCIISVFLPMLFTI